MRRAKPMESELIRADLVSLLTNFADELKKDDLRTKVIALIPAFHKLRDLGSSLIPREDAPAARDRIIAYLKQYPEKVIDGDELMVVSGIGEWARRLRELRVQFGWWIYSGVTFKNMSEDDEENELLLKIGIDSSQIKPDQYVLMSIEQDIEAAYRWNVINEIRRKKISVHDKLIEYFRKNVGKKITGEELMYLADGKTEWARRVRELRTQEGWPISTKNSGRDDLPVGVYILEEDRQAYEHDRQIPDLVRVDVLTRDDFKCVQCDWNRSALNQDDPRKMLELHHVTHHKDGGENTVENLITLCNVCHDDKHRG
ncbi:HNH endonuclease [Anaeroarcus burkinensis]|uniref:HNH endonuclease n=1 Tax=Anaeroarcus burkinensis TaxID=82376 RepID=UPI0004245559|nr:HNH endonuclease signature motif containing protein [Anaeroarcus burkinensis]